MNPLLTAKPKWFTNLDLRVKVTKWKVKVTISLLNKCRKRWISTYFEPILVRTAEYIENSKLCFRDMKIMSRRNGVDSVNNESAVSTINSEAKMDQKF